jgi:hypothetical protein
MFLELREYRVRPGQRDAFVRVMDEMVIPFQRSKGMIIVGSYVSLEEEDLYVWLRRFESEEQRKKLYDDVYGDSYWKNEIKTALGDMLLKDTVKVRLLEATPGSFEVSSAGKPPARLRSLR